MVYWTSTLLCLLVHMRSYAHHSPSPFVYGEIKTCSFWYFVAGIRCQGHHSEVESLHDFNLVYGDRYCRIVRLMIAVI